MALQMAISAPPFALRADASGGQIRVCWGRVAAGRLDCGVRRRIRAAPVRSAAEVGVAAAGAVTEVDKENFWPMVEAAGEKVVVLDMYTQWCGPCKLFAPKYQELSEKYPDVMFLKLDCNHENRPLAKELGVKVVPTFKILKNGKVVKEVTGTKEDVLAMAIEDARSS